MFPHASPATILTPMYWLIGIISLFCGVDVYADTQTLGHVQNLVNTCWFDSLSMIGVLGFATSGLVLAYRHNITLLGAFFLALLPALGGGAMRDVMLGRFPIVMLHVKEYFLAVLLWVFLGILLVRLLGNSPHTGKHRLNTPFTFWLFQAGDALGMATFIVTGVMAVMVMECHPLWLWGTFFALLTGVGGGMIRDALTAGGDPKKISVFSDQPYGVIAVIGGLFLSLYLEYCPSLSAIDIQTATVLTVLGAFVLRILVLVFKIPNIHFDK